MGSGVEDMKIQEVFVSYQNGMSARVEADFSCDLFRGAISQWNHQKLGRSHLL